MMLDDPEKANDVPPDVDPVDHDDSSLKPGRNEVEQENVDVGPVDDRSRSSRQLDLGQENEAEQVSLPNAEEEKDSSLDIAEGGLIARLNLREHNEDATKNHDEIKKIVEKVQKNKLEQKKDKSGNVEHLQNGKSVLSEKKTKDGISFRPTKNTNGTLTISIPQKNPDGTLSKDHFDVIEINKDGEVENFRSANLRVAEDGSIEKSHSTKTTSQLDMKWLQSSLQKSRSGAKVVGHEAESGVRVTAQKESTQEQVETRPRSSTAPPGREDFGRSDAVTAEDTTPATRPRANTLPARFSSGDQKEFAAVAASLRQGGMTTDQSKTTKVAASSTTPAVDKPKSGTSHGR